MPLYQLIIHENAPHRVVSIWPFHRLAAAAGRSVRTALLSARSTIGLRTT
jgi:hypothetical protein